MSAEKDPVMEEGCKSILQALDDNETEIAARTSYRYFKSPAGNTEDRDACALRMIDRHWVAQSGKSDKVLKSVKATIEFRKSNSVDEFRECFEKDTATPNSEEQNERQAIIESQLSNGKLVVRGFDKEKRSLFVYTTRKEMHPGCDPNWLVRIGIFYSFERAIACTEAAGGGDQVIALFDYTDWGFRNNPPILITKEFIQVTQTYYPENLKSIYVVNTPFLFRAFWAVIKHFVDPITRKKVHFVSGEEQRKEHFEEIIDLDHAQAFMLPEGKRTEDVDAKRYMHDMAFDQAYDK